MGDSARVLQGVAAGDSFGYSVAGAGDLNGDGFSDVVVGAFQAIPAALASAGTASVYYGSVSGVQLGATAVLEGRAASDYFGYSVASAGDVNGDGFGDLIVGAYQPSPGGRLRAGTASLFHGRADALSMRAERVIDGATAQDFFGFSVASAGDVNGDGFGDVVIGATRASPGGRANAGAVSVYLGRLNGVAMAPARVLEGSAESDAFGGAVMGVGDLNGDGFADLVVGANSASPGGLTNAGTATVFHGSLTGIPALPARVLEGASALEQFGFSVASVGVGLGSRWRMRRASL